MTTSIPIVQIRTDGGTQSRAALDDATVDDYRVALTDGADLPPLTVFHDGASYWLADGFHRLAALKARGATVAACDVRQGTQRDAVLYSVGANATHGLRRSAADKRRAVALLLRDDEWSKWSNREIARRAAVSLDLVNRMRAEQPEQLNDRSVRGADGKVRNVAGIARANAQRAQAAPSAPPTPEPSPEALPPLPPALAAAWTRYRDDDTALIGMQHLATGYRLTGRDLAALEQQALAAARPLAELANGWRVFYDPGADGRMDMHAYTASHQEFEVIAAHDLARLGLAAWLSRMYVGDLPDMDQEVIDALWLAGWDWSGTAWTRGWDRIDEGTSAQELRYLAGLAERPAAALPDLAPVVQQRAVIYRPTIPEWNEATERAGQLGLRISQADDGALVIKRKGSGEDMGFAADWHRGMEILSAIEAEAQAPTRPAAAAAQAPTPATLADLPELPPRPRAPRSADSSAQLRYLAELERYADAATRRIAALEQLLGAPVRALRIRIAQLQLALADDSERPDTWAEFERISADLLALADDQEIDDQVYERLQQQLGGLQDAYGKAVAA